MLNCWQIVVVRLGSKENWVFRAQNPFKGDMEAWRLFRGNWASSSLFQLHIRKLLGGSVFHKQCKRLRLSFNIMKTDLYFTKKSMSYYFYLIISVCLLEVKYEFFFFYYIFTAHINHFYPKSILKFKHRGFYNLSI